MLKKMFVVFLVCSFVSNIFALNALALGTQPAAACAQKEQRAADVNGLLEGLKSMDTSGLPYPAAFLNSSMEKYQLLADHYLQEIAADNDSGIAPGCLPPYTIAFLDVFALTPMLSGATLYEIFESSIDVECVWGSAFGALVPFTWGLINWVDYRICAERNSDSPDQETIDLLEQDRTFLVQFSFVSLALAAFWGSACGELFGGVFSNSGRN